MLRTDIEVACRKPDANPDMWFSSKKADIEKAKLACSNCPQVLACLHDALEFERISKTTLLGVHGGTTPSERRTFRMKRIA